MAFTALEIQLKADVKDLKKSFNEVTKEVTKLKKNLNAASAPLEKMGKALADNTKLAAKLSNIGASRTKIIENNLKLSLDQLKSTEKQLKLAGRLDSSSQKALNKRASLLEKIAAKEITTLIKAEAALEKKNSRNKAAANEAEKLARANKKTLEIQNNLSVIADKNRIIALKSANIGADAIQKVRNQLSFDLKSLDLQREKLKIAKRLNRDVVTGLNKQKALITEMASKKIALIDASTIKRSTGLLGRLKDGFKSAAIGVVVFNQALELIGKAMRAFRFVFSNTVQKFADFETSLIGVSKTTSLSGESLDLFGRQIQSLSGKIPATNEELLKIAEIAGQLGVDGSKNLLNFADTMTRVAVSTDLTAEQAATDFTKILNVTRTSIDKIDEFASVIVDLGNNFATSESKIVRMTNEVARATTAFDVAAHDAAAFATAMSSMGIRAEIGGSVLGRSMVKIEESIIKGGVEFRKLQEITGETGDQLKKTFSTDATKVTRQFISGLNRMRLAGKSVIQELAEFGLKGDEVNKVIPPLVKNVDELDRAFGRARKEMANATALIIESDKQFNTLNSRIKILSNTFETLGVEVGRLFSGLVTGVVNGLIVIGQGLIGITSGLRLTFDLFSKLVSEGKVFTVVLTGIGIAALASAGFTSFLSASFAALLVNLTTLIPLLITASGTMIAFAASTAFLGVKVLALAIGLAAVASAVELVIKNFSNLDQVALSILTSVASAINLARSQVLEMARALGLLLQIVGLDTAGQAVIDQVEEEQSALFKQTQKNLDDLQKSSEGLDLGLGGQGAKDLFMWISKAQDGIEAVNSGTARSTDKVAKIFTKAGLTAKELKRTESELLKIQRENAKIRTDINNIGATASQQIVNNLRLAGQELAIREKKLILEGKINASMGKQDSIAKALGEQGKLLIEQAQKDLDALGNQEILSSLSVDVVFGSFDGFTKALDTIFGDSIGDLDKVFSEGFDLGKMSPQDTATKSMVSLAEAADVAANALLNIQPGESGGKSDAGSTLSATSTVVGGAGGAAAGVAGGLGFVKAIVDAIQALVDFIPQLIDSISKLFESITDFPTILAKSVKNLDKALLRFITDFIPNLIESISTSLMQIGDLIKNIPRAFLELMQNIPGMLIELFNELPDIIENIVEGLVSQGPLLALAFIEFVIEGLPKIITAFVRMIPRVVKAIINGLIKGMKMVAGQFSKLLQGKALDFGSLEDSGKKAVKNVMRSITGVGTQLFQVAELAGKAKVAENARKGAEAIRQAGRDAANFIQKVWEMLKMWVEKAFKFVSDLWEALKDIVAKAWEFVSKLWEGLKAVVQLAFQFVLDLWDALILVVEMAFQFVADLWEGLKELVEKAFQVVTDLWEGFKELVGDAFQVVTDLWEGFEALVKLAFQPVVDLFDGLKKIFEDAVKPIADIFDTEKLKKVFTDVFDTLNPENLLKKMFNIDAGAGGKGTIEKLIGIDMPFVSFAQGGVVPGTAKVSGNSLSNDTVPALLSAQEFVVPRSLTQKPEVMAILNALMQGKVPKMMAKGGFFGGTTAQVFDSGKKTLGGAADKLGIDVSGLSSGVIDNISKFMENPAAGLSNLIQSGGESLKNGLLAAIKSLGFDKIVDPIAFLLGEFKKMSRIMIGGTKERAGLQTGGVISGFGGGDRLPFNLEPGEGVLNKETVKRLGAGAVNRMNQGGAIGNTAIDISLVVHTTQPIDERFIRSKLMPVVKEEFKRQSLDGTFLMSKKGLR